MIFVVFCKFKEINREFVADSVIQASGTVEFEDGLRTGVLQEDCWCPYGVRTNPLVNVRAPMWRGMTLGEVYPSGDC